MKKKTVTQRRKGAEIAKLVPLQPPVEVGLQVQKLFDLSNAADDALEELIKRIARWNIHKALRLGRLFQENHHSKLIFLLTELGFDWKEKISP
jgi:hypothetical protein